MTLHKTEPNTPSLRTFALIALAGGLAGALVALMFAPKRGKDLRQDIHETIKNFHLHSEDKPQPSKTGYITLKYPNMPRS